MTKSEELKLDEVINRIITLNQQLREFWTSSHGWAPIVTADLISKSRLDWQVSLSKCLEIWIADAENEINEGRLILSWANLGSLVEGTMKLFLSVYYMDYTKDIQALKRKEKVVEPDSLCLELLRQFFKNRIWNEFWDWDKWILHIQQRRNAIHAFKQREIGSFDEFYADLRNYLEFLRDINGRLPYPDDHWSPSEFAE